MQPESRISLIAAISAENRVIGNGTGLIWHIPDDLAYFHRTTKFHSVIAGRTTYFSIPAAKRPLSDRTNIVMTRDTSFTTQEDVLVAHSIQEALTLARKAPGADEIFVIGGGVIYEEALPLADRLYLTRIYAEADGTVFFPEYKGTFTKIVSQSERYSWQGIEFDFLVLERP